MKKCFFAYSDKGSKISDSIKEAVDRVNDGGIIDIKPWNAMDIQGRSIPREIISSIDECEIFICDNSNLNDNVLYELGYAIGKKKHVRIYVNTAIKGVNEQLKKINVLSTVGYTEYNNSQQLYNELWKLTNLNSPYLIDELSLPQNHYTSVTEILYLKSIKESEKSLWVSTAIKKLNSNCHVDDPEEMISQSLEWYIKEIIFCNGLIAYFQDDLEGAQYRNNTISLVVGIAKGLSIPTLLLAPNTYDAPMDFKDQIVRFSNKEQCENAIHRWIHDNSDRLKSGNGIQVQQELRQRNKLKSIDIGQNIAENEPEEILKYFVETSAYRDAQSRNLSLFIGRKGVGKTANLYKLADTLHNGNNLVCVIKPIQYEIDGILEIMQQLTSAEKSYLVQSIWKYLIYTELLKTIYEMLNKRPIYYEKSKSEKEIFDFVESKQDIIIREFSERTHAIISNLKASTNSNLDQEKYRLKVSEILHNNVISIIRKSLSDYCGEKKRIVILIDNLDKSWNVDANVELLSKFIYGLLDVGEAIVKDFSKDSNWNKKVNITLVVFLREDIFSVIKHYAPEVDKLQISKMIWDDKELLLRVIEERIKDNGSVDIWKEYFCDTIKGVPTKEYLLNIVLPKPRDFITLVRYSLENANNRNHTIIEEKDVEDAIEKYSTFAEKTLVTELQVEFPEIEDFLYQLLGEKNIISEEKLHKCMRNVQIAEEKQEELKTLLCKMLFLGMEIKADNFQFCYDLDNYKKFEILSDKLSDNKRYSIHPAFHAALMIEI